MKDATRSPAQPAPITVAGTGQPEPNEQFAKFQLKPEDIGGELLPILSKGLYTDPLHAVREYVQNSVDANAQNALVQLTGNAVLISDDGKGMGWPDLIEARRFGVSHKNSQEHVGFRGIGLYSAFDLCNRLLITSSVEGEPFENVLVFDFGGMKSLLKRARDARTEQPPLHTLLEDFSEFKRIPADEASHGTVVQLEDVESFHLGRLKDEEALKSYILKTLPVAFDELFEHRDKIQSTLAAEVPGFKAVRIVLEITPGKRIVVAKPAIPNLSEPVFSVIHDPTGRKIAVIWSCLNGADGKRQQIPDGMDKKTKDKTFVPFRGFVYKVKGFSIGDNTRLQNLFARSTLYSWYTGEVYVTDENVRPNTERDEFESSPAYDYLKTKVEESLGVLEANAGTFQAQGRAAELFNRHNERLVELERDIKAGVGRNHEHWSELKAIVQELTKQQGKLPKDKDKKAWAREILKKATGLRDLVEKAIEGSSSSSRRTKPNTAPPTGEETGGSADDSTQDEEESAETNLARMVEEAGIELTDQWTSVLTVIDEAIASVLFRGSAAHKAVLNEIEKQLSRTLGESD